MILEVLGLIAMMLLIVIIVGVVCLFIYLGVEAVKDLYTTIIRRKA